MRRRGGGAVIFGAGLSAALVFAACGSSSNKADAGAGGAAGTGGKTGSGGASGTGGATGSGGASTVDAGAGGAIDAPVDSNDHDTPAVACDLGKPFGAPALIPSLNVGSQEVDVWLTDDSSAALVALTRTGLGCCDIYGASRTTTGDFGPLTPLANINSALYVNRRPVLSSDRKTLFFASNRPDGDGGLSSNIFVATRNDALADFGTPILLAGENTAAENSPGSLSADDHLLYFDSDPVSSPDIYVRDLTTGGPSSPVAELNTPYSEASAVISNDGRTIYFGTTRPQPGTAPDAGKLDFDVWVAHRSAANGTFSAPAPVTELNTSFDELPNWLSPDGCTIYLSSNRDDGNGDRHILVASKPAN